MNEELMNLFGESEENFNALMYIKRIDGREFPMKKKVIPALIELKKKFEGEGLTVEVETDLKKLSERYGGCVMYIAKILKKKI